MVKKNLEKKKNKGKLTIATRDQYDLHDDLKLLFFFVFFRLSFCRKKNIKKVKFKKHLIPSIDYKLLYIL